MNIKKTYPLYFLALPVAIYAMLYFIPSLFSFYYAMTDWNTYTDKIHFVGLDNFKQIFTSTSGYLKSLENTVVFALTTTLLQNVFGLALALVLNASLKTKNALRMIFFLTVTLSPLVVGLVFSSIYHPDYGFLNTLLSSIGLGSWTQAWLVEASFAMPSVIFVEVWKFTGFNMVIYLAGLQTVPKVYTEVATIDGARKVDVFRFVTLPLIMPAVSINLILNLINGFKVFDLIFILTKGGPGNLTQVLNTAVFSEFSAGRYGLSTAFGVLLLLLTAVVALSSLKILSGKSEVDV